MSIKFWTKLTPGTHHAASEIEVRDFNNRDQLVGWLVAYSAEGQEDFTKDMQFYKGWRVSKFQIEGEAKELIANSEFLGIIPF